MSRDEKKPKVRIDLTPEQQLEIKRTLGKEAEALELTGEDLEERIAPYIFRPIDKPTPK